VLDLLTGPDLLRLLAVPVFGWAAYRDVRTRRVPNRTWYPPAAVGLLALLWDVWRAPAFRQDVFALRVVLSLGIVAPLAYLFWRLGGFGGADAKALMVLALLFPVFPTVYLPATPLPVFDATALPPVETTLGVFSLTILTNAVLVGVLYPVALGVRNLLAGQAGVVALVGRPVGWDAAERTHGRLLETPEGYTREGLDLDALRMYLRYRGVELADLRADPSLRDPATLPEVPGDPTDGAVETDGGVPGASADTSERTVEDDPWGAAEFLGDIDHHAYGTTPDQLRDGLDVLVERETVWVSPGIPFLVPLFVGLLVGLVYGDILFGLLDVLGAV